MRVLDHGKQHYVVPTRKMMALICTGYRPLLSTGNVSKVARKPSRRRVERSSRKERVGFGIIDVSPSHRREAAESANCRTEQKSLSIKLYLARGVNGCTRIISDPEAQQIHFCASFSQGASGVRALVLLFNNSKGGFTRSACRLRSIPFQTEQRRRADSPHTHKNW